MSDEVKKFVRVSYDDMNYICYPEYVAELTAMDDEDSFTTKEVWMTQTQYNSLPEFEG